VALQTRISDFSRRRRLYLAYSDGILNSYSHPKLCAILRWIFEIPRRQNTYCLTAMYLHVYFQRNWVPRPLVRHDDSYRVVLPFSHRLEAAGLAQIIHGATSLLPADVTKLLGKPDFAFKLAATSSQSVLATRATANSASRSMVQQGRQRHCACHLFPGTATCISKYSNNEHHLLTTDYSVLSNASLSTFLDMGAKMRVAGPEDADDASLLVYIKGRLNDYIAAAAKQTGANRTTLQPFVVKVVDDCETALANVVDPTNQAHLQTLAGLQRDALAHLDLWKETVTVKLCDKQSDRYVLVCRWSDAREAWGLIDDLGDAYAPAGASEQTIARQVAASCTAFRDVVWHEDRHPSVRARCGPSKEHPTRPPRIGHLYVNYKLHKEIPAPRPIVGARFKPETPTANRVTSALNLTVISQADRVRHDALLILYHYVSPRSHMLSGCDDLRPAVDNINSLLRRRVLDINTFKFSIFDFKAMYTKFSHEMMKTALTDLITYAFRAEFIRSKNRFIAVPHHHLCKIFESVWIPNNTLPGHLSAENYAAMSLDGLLQRLCFLIDNAYFTFGGEIKRLAIGVAMGLGPAAILANATCFFYEIQFLKRVITAYNKHVANFPAPLSSTHQTERTRLHTLVLSMVLFLRYIDDCLIPAIDNLDPNSFLYDQRTSFNSSQDGSSLDGIYPERAPGPNGTLVNNPCELEMVTPPSRVVNYLDWTLYIDRERGSITTKVFDKRLNMPAFAACRTFPHHDSVMATRTKYSIITSQLVRFARRCSSMTSFARSAARMLELMLKNQYPPRHLLLRLRSFGARHWRSRASHLGRFHYFLRKLYYLLPRLGRRLLSGRV
jgi:hypothetical protein